jgi:hypothetical protein
MDPFKRNLGAPLMPEGFDEGVRLSPVMAYRDSDSEIGHVSSRHIGDDIYMKSGRQTASD